MSCDLEVGLSSEDSPFAKMQEKIVYNRSKVTWPLHKALHVGFSLFTLRNMNKRSGLDKVLQMIISSSIFADANKLSADRYQVWSPITAVVSCINCYIIRFCPKCMCMQGACRVVSIKMEGLGLSKWCHFKHINEPNLVTKKKLIKIRKWRDFSLQGETKYLQFGITSQI